MYAYAQCDNNAEVDDKSPREMNEKSDKREKCPNDASFRAHCIVALEIVS